MKSVILLGLVASWSLTATAQSLPQVDLGYEIHQALSYNATADVYNFMNIRYAQAPVGELRFAAPVPPTGRNTVVQNGSSTPICPQAAPGWYLVANQFSTAFAYNNLSSFNFTQAEQIAAAEIAAGAASALALPGITEDCLFLDVVVPKAILDNANNKHRKRTSGAPVLVWIYGGGYTVGSKNAYGSPNGLIRASQAAGSQGLIFVAMNYRLGALGWLAGPTLQSSGGVSNAGLYDQRLAIEWVKTNIHLFGGDPELITLVGESAGGGSIEHQITAYGGLKPVPFQRAVLQSPAWLPVTSQYVQENATQEFLGILNVSSIEGARSLPSEAVIEANTYQIGNAPYGSFVYGPVVDGVFAPALPGLSFLQGSYAHNISVMLGHNTNEGPFFTPPFIATDAEIAAWLPTVYPGISPSIIAQILVFYPAASDYVSGILRTIRLITEQVFTCNTNYMARAYGNNTYNYEFAVPPALHGQDVAYTFYDGAATTVMGALATVLQTYIANFVMAGNPNGPGLPAFPMQGMNASLNALNVTGVDIQVDDTVNERCVFWQKALYT